MFTHLGLDVASKLCVSLLLLCRQYLTSQCLGRLAKGDLLRAARGVPGTRARELPGLQTPSWTAQTPRVAVLVNEKSEKVRITEISPGTHIIFV